MKIVFVTGTRADFGKLKPLISKIDVMPNQFSVSIVVTGMHLLDQFGFTAKEVQKVFPGKEVFLEGQRYQEEMTLGFARFTQNFTGYLEECRPDLVVVHGDRFDALAASIVANSLMVPVAHIEGGEVSGTIDEAIRHSVSKFSHIHFVANEEAGKRVRRLGEDPNKIFVVGSPETDVLLGDDVPSLSEVKEKYDIAFDQYSILCFHPVVNEIEKLGAQLDEIEKFVREVDENLIWIYPNNDKGSLYIIERIKELRQLKKIKVFESLRFEYYVSLLRNANFVLGNTSSGVREAPVLGVPCINVGSRQNGRVDSQLVLDTEIDFSAMMSSLKKVRVMNVSGGHTNFGSGSVADKIVKVLNDINIGKVEIQKVFHE